MRTKRSVRTDTDNTLCSFILQFLAMSSSTRLSTALILPGLEVDFPLGETSAKCMQSSVDTWWYLYPSHMLRRLLVIGLQRDFCDRSELILQTSALFFSNKHAQTYLYYNIQPSLTKAKSSEGQMKSEIINREFTH